MTEKKLVAMQYLVEGKLSKKEIADRLNISKSTLSRWEKEAEFKQRKSICLEHLNESIIKNLTRLADRLLERICESEDELSPREALDILVKILEKGEKLGFNLKSFKEDSESGIESLSDSELQEIIRKHFERDEKETT